MYEYIILYNPALEAQMPLSEADKALLAENIDRLMTVDVPGRGFVTKAYPDARRLTGVPLVRHAGDQLLELLGQQPRRTVLIATGATTQRPGLPDHIGEMDGPPGALALARFVGLAFNALPVLVTDPQQSTMLSQGAAALGLYTLPYDALRRQAEAMPHVSAVHIVEMPDDDAAANRVSAELLAHCQPVALVAIEKAGKNERGVYHNSQKKNTSSGKARVDALFEACSAAGIFTVGVGDGGNELGMGNIRDALLDHFPHMAKCNCPCEGSILAVQKADSLVVATVSNWGAYALAAYMAAVHGAPYAAHSPARERAVLSGCARAGYMNLDGFSVPGADGLPVDVHAAFVGLLSCMVHWPPLEHGRAGVLGDLLAP